MVARVSSYAGPADRLDDLVRGFEQSADAVRELDGFEDAYLLVGHSVEGVDVYDAAAPIRG
jgi:heme-degrading monooxygenase HmoA